MNQLKLRNTIMSGLLVLLLAIVPFLKSNADQYYPPSGGGSGSVTGDGTVEQTSAPGGVLSLANAAAYTGLYNNSGSAAAPTYGYGLYGFQSYATSTTLTANSPGYNLVTANSVVTTLPVASTCIGKPIYVYNSTTSYANLDTIVRQGSDVITLGDGGSTLTTYTLQNNCGMLFMATASGVWSILAGPNFPVGSGSGYTAGGLFYTNSTGVLTSISAGAPGSVLTGGNIPAFSLTPGSSTPLTSITANHDLSGGSTPTFTAGAGAGSGPTISVTGTDKAGYVTVTTGSAPSASAVVVTVTFAVAYGSTPKAVLIGDAASNDAVLSGNARVWADQGGLATSGFTLNVGSTNLAATTTYIWWYHVDG